MMAGNDNHGNDYEDEDENEDDEGYSAITILINSGIYSNPR